MFFVWGFFLGDMAADRFVSAAKSGIKSIDLAADNFVSAAKSILNGSMGWTIVGIWGAKHLGDLTSDFWHPVSASVLFT